MELRIVAELWLACSSKATATTLVMSVTGDSRTEPASGCPWAHTWRWHNLAHSVHPTGTNTAASPAPETCTLRLPPHKTQCMWNAALHLLRHTQAPENKSNTSQWPKGILSRNNSGFIEKCYDKRKVFLKIIWFLPSSFSGCIFFNSTVGRIQ